MREVLELCVTLDRIAADTYRDMAVACPDAELATVLENLSKEERQHVEWWWSLLDAWGAGLLPDIAFEHELLDKLNSVRDETAAAIPPSLDSMTVDEMLDVAARLEFYMLDPVFGELLELLEPGSHVEHREAYNRHVNRLIGAIEKHHSQEGLSSFLARLLARALRDQQRYAALSVRDQLTGLYNRRGLLSHLSHWLSWSARYDRPLAVVLVDVDRFKSVNDTYGHVTGDDALRAIADALRKGVRTSDMVGRFGGDEFLVLAPETSEPELVALMERLLECVRGAVVDADGEPVRLSVSVGGAWTSGERETSPETLVSAADRSLYSAKSAGRDCAGPPETAQPAA